MFNRKNWLWAALLAAPLAAVAVVYANSQARSGYVCPITGETLPCEKCCPLNQQAQEQPYTCPITGEELPCPNCCPLNQGS
jgi:hypothetical protein